MQVLKLSKVHFVEDSVFLDLVLNLVMHVNSASPYMIALEAALFAGGSGADPGKMKGGG